MTVYHPALASPRKPVEVSTGLTSSSLRHLVYVFFSLLCSVLKSSDLYCSSVFCSLPLRRDSERGSKGMDTVQEHEAKKGTQLLTIWNMFSANKDHTINRIAQERWSTSNKGWESGWICNRGTRPGEHRQCSSLAAGARIWGKE
jgi:hypothetical protein